MYIVCDASPAVTFSAAEYHWLWRVPNHYCYYYCLVIGVHVCEQLAWSRYAIVRRPGIERLTS